ncbi:hypothetical protein ABVN80_06790 [Acinetobacter baumannii]
MGQFTAVGDDDQSIYAWLALNLKTWLCLNRISQIYILLNLSKLPLEPAVF